MVNDMKEKILSILEESDKALSIDELDSALNLNTIEETKEFSDALRELEDSYEIYRSNKNRYMLLENSNLRKGKLCKNNAKSVTREARRLKRLQI